MKTKTILSVVLLFAACAWRSSAQATFDSTGDGQLNGAYYMRQVLYLVTDNAGDIGEYLNIQGTITFNGSGSYAFSGTFLDSASGSTTPANVTSNGTYVISASGEGYLSAIVSAIDSNFPGDQIIGLVSHNVFIGSSTETANGYNDLFIAAPITSTPATNATLNGSYTVAYFDPSFVSNGIPGGDALFTLTADGQGNIGTVNVTGYLGANTTASTQAVSNVTYSFSNGAAQINFGGNSRTSLIGGTDLLYITPDGNFVFGGNFNGFDMFVGVRAATSNPTNYDALYYQAGLDLDNGTITSDDASLLDSYYGSLQAVAAQSCVQPNCFIGHQRVNSPLGYGGSSDFTYYDSYTLNGDGSSSDYAFGQDYVSSTDGTIRIGYGIGPLLGINVAFQAPSFSGPGVYLYPTGVVNAASSAPFTAFLSPGEFITLYGTNLAPSTASATVPFPNTLSGVQVLINQVQAPIYYVSPTVISVIVPFIISPQSVAEIQVVNATGSSNIVTQFTGSTSAGAFTNSPLGGIGIAAAERADYSIISEANPAQIGDTIAVYVAGMGAVTNQPADGTAAPTDPLSQTEANPVIYVVDVNGNGAQANPNENLPFSGLAPYYAGLYQLNFTVPTGLAAGDASLEIVGPDSDNYEAILPLTTASSARAKSDKRATHFHHHKLRADQLRVTRLRVRPIAQQ